MGKKPIKQLPGHSPELQREIERLPVSEGEARLSISFSDILPPDLLEEYEKIIPGFKNEFFHHWKEDRKIKQESALAEIKSKNRASFSLSFTSIVAMTTVTLSILGIIGLAAYLIYRGEYKEAVALLGGVMGLSIFGNYVAGKTK
jgi:uncharacterized membrane protein